MARLDWADFERPVIWPLLPTKMRGVSRARRPPHAERHLAAAYWRAAGRVLACRRPRATGDNGSTGGAKASHFVHIPASVSVARDENTQVADSPSIRVRRHAVNGRKGPAVPLHGPLARRADHQDPCAWPV